MKDYETHKKLQSISRNINVFKYYSSDTSFDVVFSVMRNIGDWYKVGIQSEFDIMVVVEHIEEPL